jgi:membrane associated rhomboid family serine protease
MANCAQCGNPMPGFSSGDERDICPECAHKQQVVEPARQRIVIWREFPVTTSIIAVCVLVYVAMSVSSGSPAAFVSPSVGDVVRWGGTFGYNILHGEWWRLVTAVFVHIGIIHIAFNMYVFWGLGLIAERLLGRWNFLATYLLTGIAGNVLSLLLKPNIVGAGASGAIFGIAGVLIAVLQFGRLNVPNEQLKPLKQEVVKLALYNLLIGAVVARINNIAHLGGLIYGLLLGLLFAWSTRFDSGTRLKIQRIGLAVATVLLVAASYGIERLYTAS